MTDSLHATVFLVLFNKPFVVTTRVDKLENRLNTLLRKFSLACRKYAELKEAFNKNDNQIYKEKILFSDFERGGEISDIEKRRSVNFYEKCFGSIL